MMNRHTDDSQYTEPTAGRNRSLSEYFEAIRSIESPDLREIESLIARSGSPPHAGASAAATRTALSGPKGRIGSALGITGAVAAAGIGAFLFLKNPTGSNTEVPEREYAANIIATPTQGQGRSAESVEVAPADKTSVPKGQFFDPPLSIAEDLTVRNPSRPRELHTKIEWIPAERPDRPLLTHKPDYTAYTVYNPEPLNSAGLDYAPLVSADGREILFVSNRGGSEEIWSAEKENPIGLEFGHPINTGQPPDILVDEGAIALSPDKQTIYFTACNRPDGLGDCDIYEGRRIGGEWQEIRNISAINSPYHDSQPTLSESGDTLYFVSSRPGALGGPDDADIYMAVRGNDADWNTPVNIGQPVNTPLREDSPFILPGSDKLYFSSAGHGGYGKLDFFVAERKENGMWGEPQNLGIVFNTPEDERMLTVTADEEVFYFASGRAAPKNLGRLDIFMAVRSSAASPIEPDIRVEEQGIMTILAFPNPATDVVSLRIAMRTSPAPDEEAVIVNRAGEEVMRLPASALQTPIPIPDLPNGLYLVRIGKFAGSFVVRR